MKKLPCNNNLRISNHAIGSLTIRPL